MLNEIRKELESSTISDIIRKYCKKAEINTGFFSLVVIPDDRDYVYKFWVSDFGFERFLEMKSPVGPKVLSYSELNLDIKADGIKKIKYAKLEKLKQLPSNLWNDELIDFDDGETQTKMSLSSFDGNSSSFYETDLEVLVNCSSTYPHIQKILDHMPKIWRTGIEYGYMNDFRQANLMIRPNGEIVINDPYASKESAHVVRLTAKAGRAIMDNHRKRKAQK
jgi:hypothetical protein